jgi:hypothetical protein
MASCVCDCDFRIVDNIHHAPPIATFVSEPCCLDTKSLFSVNIVLELLVMVAIVLRPHMYSPRKDMVPEIGTRNITL